MQSIRGFRRFENHSFQEVLGGWLVPRDWNRIVSVGDVPHTSFDLAAAPGLYVPEKNKAHQRGDIRGFLLENAIAWPSVGAVRTEGGGLISESFPYHSTLDFAVKARYLGRLPKRSLGFVTTIGTVYRNYYHRLVDSISRLYCLQHPFVQIEKSIVLLIDPRFTQDELRAIRFLCPSNVKLKRIAYGRRISAAKYLHLPYLSTDRVAFNKWFKASAGYIPNECLEWLKLGFYECFNLSPTNPFRNLFITRRHAKVRRLLNEDEVSCYLKKRGFETVALEHMSLEEQVKIFSEARLVVGQHGAGLSNLIFSQFTSVIEILSDDAPQLFFERLSASRGFPHIQVRCAGDAKNADVHLPLELLESALNEIDELSKIA